MNRRELIELR